MTHYATYTLTYNIFNSKNKKLNERSWKTQFITLTFN